MNKKEYWKNRIEELVIRAEKELAEANQYLVFIGEDKELVVRYRNINKESKK